MPPHDSVEIHHRGHLTSRTEQQVIEFAVTMDIGVGFNQGLIKPASPSHNHIMLRLHRLRHACVCNTIILGEIMLKPQKITDGVFQSWPRQIFEQSLRSAKHPTGCVRLFRCLQFRQNPAIHNMRPASPPLTLAIHISRPAMHSLQNLWNPAWRAVIQMPDHPFNITHNQ